MFYKRNELNRFKALTNGIAADGEHNITVLGVDVDKKAPSNVHYIEMEKVYDMMYGLEEGQEAPALNITELCMNDQTTSEELTMFGGWCNIVCEGKFFFCNL